MASGQQHSRRLRASEAAQAEIKSKHRAGLSRTAAVALNFSVWLRYSAPGQELPMIAANMEATSMPGMMALAPLAEAWMGLESPVRAVNAATSAAEKRLVRMKAFPG
jgi:hypothetical protein